MTLWRRLVAFFRVDHWHMPSNWTPHAGSACDECGRRISARRNQPAHPSWADVIKPLSRPVNAVNTNPRARMSVVRDLMPEKRKRTG
jgi:hypothetical protein